MDESTRRVIMHTPCAAFIGAVGHHAHFTGDDAARTRLVGFCRRIREQGARIYLNEEYPARGGKAFIVNLTQGKPCLVDGNAHMVALVACDPQLTLARLVEIAGRDDIIRLWQDGWEDGSDQDDAYDVYIPVGTDTGRVPEARVDTDWFKQPPSPTKVIPATIPFDSPLLAENDRGRLIGETAAWLRGLL